MTRARPSVSFRGGPGAPRITPTEAELCTGGSYISAEPHGEAFAVGASLIVADADNNSAPGRELKKPEDCVVRCRNICQPRQLGLRRHPLEVSRKYKKGSEFSLSVPIRMKEPMS